MNEAETRAEYIDPALKAAGWGEVEGSRISREYQLTEGRLQGGGERSKADIADYVLVYRNPKLAVIEAKRWDLPHSDGAAQAKEYAKKLSVRFAYATNGQAIYGIDMALGSEADVATYPTPDELWDRTYAEENEWRDRFATVSLETKGGTWGGRYYQDIATRNVLEAVAAGKKRILLTMATGTGKTGIAAQIAWKLFKSRWNLTGQPARQPRILFLADRNILADQAYNEFSFFPEDALVRIAPADIRKKGKVPKNGSIFFTIFQTFMSGDNDTPYFGEYPADFFDFIVVDECHRGGANDESTWRTILDYFSPAVQLGMTATPKRKDNVDTYRYFGDPVYIYSLKEGINDGYLTPFRVRQISTTMDEYVYTSDDTVIDGEVEPGKLHQERDFNKIIEINGREAYRVSLFMGMIDQREKTLVFCATQLHALAVRDLINQIKSSKNPSYCVRVTANDGALGDQYLREFRDNEKTIPTVLTTSQKLSTGVDARNVRNIVLMRPVNTMIEFKQIVGRGTRIYEGKDHFTIYDFVKAHNFFSDPEWDGEPEEVTEPTIGIIAGPSPEPAAGVVPKVVEPAPDRAVVKLADGKERTIQSMVQTSFWDPSGTPMTAAEFLVSLFGALPAFFENEAGLRAIWSLPATRKALLAGLAEKGFGPDAHWEMQRVIDAQGSDVYDVLAYVAFALQPLTRVARAGGARAAIRHRYTDRQQAFLDFVLDQYTREGVGELDADKLAPLLRLKYKAITDATAELGDPTLIRDLFVGFQRYLYEPTGSFEVG
ncbi:MAG: DEAD/DEAH box helicase family protein [Chloroflexi bacterium]|nr:DEAD/DEAH box helicase family protein [Chloroflexota bacterium]